MYNPNPTCAAGSGSDRDIPLLLGAYANGFRDHSDTYREDLAPDAYLAHAKQWREDGAGIIGGCCGIFPEHVRALRQYCS